jgi:hypothetical protein
MYKDERVIMGDITAAISLIQDAVKGTGSGNCFWCNGHGLRHKWQRCVGLNHCLQTYLVGFNAPLVREVLSTIKGFIGNLKGQNLQQSWSPGFDATGVALSHEAGVRM